MTQRSGSVSLTNLGPSSSSDYDPEAQAAVNHSKADQLLREVVNLVGEPEPGVKVAKADGK